MRLRPLRRLPSISLFLLCSILCAFAFSHTSSGYAQETPQGGAPSAPLIHIVQQGETLADIARRYATTVDLLAAANSLDASRSLVVGQRLIIPVGDSMPGAAVVIAGISDTLEVLAAESGSSIEEIAALNRIVNPAQLYAGQPLMLPADAHNNGLVRLDSQNTLWHIALRGNLSIRALMAQNRIDYPYIYAPGQLILAPPSEIVGPLLRSPWATIALSPVPLEAGRSAALHIETTGPATLSASFMGDELQFAADGTGFTTILGVYRWTPPGLYPLAITAQNADGTTRTFSRQIMVSPGGYASEMIHLSEEDAAVYADTESVQGEANFISGLMSGFTPERLWDGLFHLPAAGVMSSGYGTARSYDSGVTYDVFHAGADFAAERGTPIYAPADGIVVETGELTVRGMFTIIDHGWGVYSGFWHQSSILVSPGDQVTMGQQIGNVGNTGLSTAPHLHWEMWVEGVQVDPLQWVRQPFP